MSKEQNLSAKAQKVDLTLVSSHANEAEARVLELGDAKYSRRDYLNRDNYDQDAMRALLRHVGEVMKGNQYDEESGQHHLAHVRANCGIILECWAVHKVEPGVNWPHEAAKPEIGSPPVFVGENGYTSGDGVKTNPVGTITNSPGYDPVSQGEAADAFEQVREIHKAFEQKHPIGALPEEKGIHEAFRRGPAAREKTGPPRSPYDLAKVPRPKGGPAIG